ncbi:MAG: hypothetical protein IK038_03625 [Bacteroidaceae bacterium]|nr:hypothetical protein [Bacteroidaceae bacterium]
MPLRRIIILIICITAFTAVYSRGLNDSIPVDTVLLDDGTLYMGQIQDSLFNGYGRCIYADGTVYEGQWKDGLWDGQGIVVYPDGDIYKGAFRNHVKQGKGTYLYGTGARYDGEWKNDMFNGNGRLLFEDGGTYDGAWKDDMKHGYGKLTSPQGRSTTGFFYNDEYLGMPFDTEINQDSTMTDDLKEWGFRQEAPHIKHDISVGLSYGFSGMATCNLWLDASDHLFWGMSIGYYMDPPTKGTVVGGIGWQSFSNDIHFTGHYISSQYLMDIGYKYKRFSIGGGVGLGIVSFYMNCRANGNPDMYDNYLASYSQAYSRKGADGQSLVYRGYLRYTIPAKEKPKAHMYLGYGNADGMFLGVGLCL